MIVEVTDVSQVSLARRTAQEAARAAGLDATGAGKIALIATELASNLIKHADGGRLVIAAYDDSSGRGLELISLDRGGGISNLAHSMEDGTSTAGSKGNGLGAIRRQADDFDIFTWPDQGTVIMARVAAAPARAPHVHRASLQAHLQRADRAVHPGTQRAVVGSIVAPHPSENVMGDNWAFAMTQEGPTVMVVDGSGHGPFAQAAADAAVQAFHENAERPCAQLIEFIHMAMASTRGGAVAVARVSRRDRQVKFVGIGNISGILLAPESIKRMVSNNGIAGHVAARIREFSYPYTNDAIVILHSDGLSSRWDLDGYPGLAYRHPSAVAGVLFRDHWRGHDDASIVALRS